MGNDIEDLIYHCEDQIMAIITELHDMKWQVTRGSDLSAIVHRMFTTRNQFESLHNGLYRLLDHS